MYILKKEFVYYVFIGLIICSIYQYGINKICGFTMYPDEFGYWSSAAMAVGRDWSAIASLGSYYSFGYSFILIPVLILFHDGVKAYRAAITINMLLMCISVFLLDRILGSVFPETSRAKRILISGIAVLYPPWIFYMQMTMVEALLMSVFVLILYLFISLIRYQKRTTAVMLAISLMYMYSVHMRTIGVLAACLIVLAVWSMVEHPQDRITIIFCGTLIVFTVLIAVLKKYITLHVFHNVETQVLVRNDYAGQWYKVWQLLTVHGLVQFCEEIVGKVFYLGMASFGSFYWGVGWCIKKVFCLVKKIKTEKKVSAGEWTALFLLLAVAAEVLISNIYMYPSSSIDSLIYGRYDDFLVPVFMLLGVITMCRDKKIFAKTFIFGLFNGLLVMILLVIIKAGDIEGLRGYMVAGISYLLKDENPNIYLFFKNTWIFEFCIMFFVVFFIWLSAKGKNAVWFLTGIIAIEIAAGMQISQHYTYRVNNSNFMDICIAKEIMCRDVKSKVVYLDEGKPQYIDFIQMQLGTRKIEVVSEEKLPNIIEGKYDFLITHVETLHKDELDNLFDKCLKSNNFYLFYNTNEDKFGSKLLNSLSVAVPQAKLAVCRGYKNEINNTNSML